VAVTGTAVYVGGHQRWQNNPYGEDVQGPGAVDREGIAALDPVNGVPLSWNPGRHRGVAAYALLATSQGLWIGSDTELIAGERRSRVALMPLAGGTEVPDVAPARLPADLYLPETATTGRLFRRAFSGTTAGTRAVVSGPPAMNWSKVRGAFLIGSTLYYGYDDGNFYTRAFRSPSDLGDPRRVDLHDAPDTGRRIAWPLAQVTGMFFDPATHRIYYTVSGNSALFYRYFTPESRLVGPETFTAQATGWGSAAGLTLASGRVYYGSSNDGDLRSVAFGGGKVSGTPRVDNGDGTWRYRAIFLRNG